MKHIFPFLFILVNFTLLQRCTEMSAIGNGGSSETVNAKVVLHDTFITVMVDRTENSGIELHVVATNYQPYERSGIYRSCTVKEDSATISVPALKSYNLFISSADSMSGFLAALPVLPNASDTVTCTLSRAGTVTGKLEPMPGKILDDSYAVSIVGSPFFSSTDDSHAFVFSSIPAGNYTISVRPKMKRLFLVTAKYAFTAGEGYRNTDLQITLP